jgi:esterase/lipase superfamily enzyme
VPTPNIPQRPLAELLSELDMAVRAGDRARATRMEQTILQRLATETAERDAIERRVRALMEELKHVEIALPAMPPAIRGVELLGIERGVEAVSPEDGGALYPVWFGTNRKPVARGDGFTGERNDRITRGRVEVFVPGAHRFGETGTPFWRRLLRFDLRDDRLRIQQITRRERDDFYAEIQRALEDARENGETGHALFYLHGYNTTFEEAAIRAAQIGYDLKVPGATAFFSWPSRGNVAAYPADEASIEASERAITDFLVEFTASCGAEKVHVIAHSMGNRGLLRALQRIAANAETRGKLRFGQIFLAAPDVDRDLFLDLARLYTEHAERTTLYASDSDLPVHLSSKLHDAPRAGYFKPYTVAAGLDTVAVPDFDIDLLGHSYFAQAEALLHDIYDLIRLNQDPARRQRIAAAFEEGATFWKIRR